MNFDGSLMVIIKGVLSIVYLFFVVKIMGKKQISELNTFDYVIGITLGNIAAEMTVNKDITIVNGIIAMSVYGIVSLIVSFITVKSIVGRRFISGFPIVLMENGKISKEQLKKVKLDLNDFMQDARENGYFDLSKIDSAVMEVSGKVSFLPKAKYAPVTNDDLKVKKERNGIVANLVIDGKIMENNLKALGKDEKWLITRLENEGYNDISKILLVLCDNKEKLTIYEMDYNISRPTLE